MDFRRLLDNLHNETQEERLIDHIIAEFQDLAPSCGFFCAGSPVMGTQGVLDKVQSGRTLGAFVNEETLKTVLSDDKMRAADKFPEYCKNNHQPLIWECDPTRVEDYDERRLFSLAADFEVRRGITVPIHQLNRETYGNLTLFFDQADLKHSERLNQTLHDIHISALYLDARLTALRSFAPKPGLLSARERDCIALLAAGYRTAQISDRLLLSDATVNEYIGNARRKLKARTRAEAVARAVQYGLVQL